MREVDDLRASAFRLADTVSGFGALNEAESRAVRAGNRLALVTRWVAIELGGFCCDGEECEERVRNAHAAQIAAELRLEKGTP